MNALATELINEHEANRRCGTTERIELTDEQASELRKGFAERQCPWGITETSIGEVQWTVFRELCWDDVQRTYREGSVLRYHPANFSIPKKKPDILVNSIATGYALQSILSNATIHQTETIGNVRLEVWSVTQEHQDETLKHWNRLKKKPTSSRKAPTHKEGPITNATYTITAHRYIQHYTPTEKEKLTPEEEELFVFYEGKYCTYELEEEVICTLTTDDVLQAQEMIKRMEEWRLDHNVTAITISIQEEGKPERIQYLQYLRSTSVDPDAPGLGMRWSRSRSWQSVPSIDTRREVIQFANTGKDY